jgi:hypothetical protein
MVTSVHKNFGLPSYFSGASVDPTEARKSAALNVGRELDPASFIAVRKAAWAAKDTAKR